MPKKLSDLELAKALAALRTIYDNDDDFNTLVQSLVNDDLQPRIHQIIRGLSQEDEFAVLCRVMGTCTSISKIGQSPIAQNFDEKAPDFLASFQIGYSLAGVPPGSLSKSYNCFVEVKSCKKKKFSISEKDLLARQKFADRFQIPLVIAVRFTMFSDQTYWVIKEASAVEKMRGKIDISDGIDSISSVLFDDYVLVPEEGLQIKEYFEKNSNKQGIKDKNFGALVKISFISTNSGLFDVPLEHTSLVCLFLQMFEKEIISVHGENEKASVISKIKEQARFLSDLAYSTNYLVKGENDKSSYDAGRFLARLDSEEPHPIVTKHMIQVAEKIINEKNMHFLRYGIGTKKQQIEKLERLLRINVFR
ncbi:MAG: hypothetical protein KA144_07190 [Xanthomonadaceae bacterium]|nr:hypothetical protein [Xanthomonadaceae bacterium]